MLDRPPPAPPAPSAPNPAPVEEQRPPRVWPALVLGLLSTAGAAATAAAWAAWTGSAPLLARLGHSRGRAAESARRHLTAQTAERARAELALRRGEERYRQLFERNPGGVYRTTVNGRLLDCNEAFAAIFGYPSRSAILAETAHALYADPADRAVFIARLAGRRARARAAQPRDGPPVGARRSAADLRLHR